ncbi:hypothetical protein [Neorickettsia sp. 179522]|uniref:hypothetical protein n=1 Tax=Neorickettsia sp. 179522 TaxID=1714371 RepID=UPI0007919F3D|nr:hypothetical protein [Neorickettsia sp. 179522]KYH12425.1 hypothetical protein AS219_01240 [Neorickettsia sp. 179522]
MINKKKQGWCFDESEVVEIKPSLYRVFVKKASTSVDLKRVRSLGTETLKLKQNDVEALCESLMQQGEWFLGTYHSDLAETIMQDLGPSVRSHGLELGISPLKE